MQIRNLRSTVVVVSQGLLAVVCGPLPMIDMMTAHDEVPMLRYRLRLHAPLAIKTIILESNLSHAGYLKPLHVRDSLTAEEIKRYNVELIQTFAGLPWELERNYILDSMEKWISLFTAISCGY